MRARTEPGDEHRAEPRLVDPIRGLVAGFLLLLSACGGGGGDSSGSGGDTAAPAPGATRESLATVPPPPPPAPPGTTIYHFSDCQTGAATGCVAGDDTHPGTAEAPKRTPASVKVNALPAGSRLLFARGGAWSNQTLSLNNPQATPEAPLLLDAYGSGPAPLLQVATGTAIAIGGSWGNTSNDGGYTIRNLHLDGLGSADRGFWFVQNVRGITLDNVEIEGFRFGIESSLGTPHGVTGLAIRNSRIHHNRSMGLLGSYSDALIDNNVFEGNNFNGSALNHAIYFSNGSRVVIRNNSFIANSVVDGVCRGGNVTAHGVVDDLLIQGNMIQQTAAVSSCYGFSVTAGYTSPEVFTNVVIRSNKVINVGMSAIAANAAPGILIEDNRVINTQNVQQYSIWVPANGGASSSDAADANAIVRNNTVCLAYPGNSVAISATAPGSQVSGNTVITGAAAQTGVCVP